MNMKKVGGIALLCISFILVSVILVGFLQKKYDHPDYEMYDFSDASEEERDAIALFYADDSSSISEGKYFDIKYAYLNPANMSELRFEIIKKNTANIIFDSITIKDRTGTIGSDISISEGIPYHFEVGKYGLVMGLADDNSFQYYSYFNGNMLFLDSNLRYLEGIGEGLSQESIERNFSQVALIFEFNNEEEVHEFQYDKEKRFLYTKECKEKLLAGEKNRYYAVQANYYYSALLYRDFEQWKTEMEQLLASGIDKGIDERFILNVPGDVSGTKSQEENRLELRESLNLNDEEFSEYLAIVKRFIDLGYSFPEYIQEAAEAV